MKAQRWEYTQVHKLTPQGLSFLGRDGWELVSVVNDKYDVMGELTRTFFLKRPLRAARRR